MYGKDSSRQTRSSTAIQGETHDNFCIRERRYYRHGLQFKRYHMTVDQYKNIFQNCLRPNLRLNRREKLKNSVAISDNNTLSHISSFTGELLTKYSWEILLHHPYSTNINLANLDYFSRLKEPIRDHRFSDLEKLLRAITPTIR